MDRTLAQLLQDGNTKSDGIISAREMRDFFALPNDTDCINPGNKQSNPQLAKRDNFAQLQSTDATTDQSSEFTDIYAKKPHQPQLTFPPEPAPGYPGWGQSVPGYPGWGQSAPGYSGWGQSAFSQSSQLHQPPQ